MCGRFVTDSEIKLMKVVAKGVYQDWRHLADKLAEVNAALFYKSEGIRGAGQLGV